MEETKGKLYLPVGEPAFKEVFVDYPSHNFCLYWPEISRMTYLERRLRNVAWPLNALTKLGFSW